MKKAERESVTIAKHIGTFLTVHVPLLEGRSENTVRSHETAISMYVGFLESEHGISPNAFGVDCFSRDMIENWMLWMLGARGCSPETCNVRLASLRSFLKYLGDKEVSMLHVSLVASTIPRMKGTKKKVKGMSRSALKSLMATPDTTTPTGRRDLALIVAIYAMATRIDEILSLKVKHMYLDAKEPYCTIVGKGNKIRSLFLPPKAVAHLRRHLKEFHGDAPEPEAYVFFSRNKGLHGKLSQAAVDKRLKEHALAASKSCKEVPIGLHAHQLRHARASHWLEEGVNIVQISLLLGHEQLETTMIYLDVTPEQKSQALGGLEESYGQSTQKKWKTGEDSLAAFCGVKPLKS